MLHWKVRRPAFLTCIHDAARGLVGGFLIAGAITLLPRPPWGAAGGTLETWMGLGRALFLHLERPGVLGRFFGRVAPPQELKQAHISSRL